MTVTTTPVIPIIIFPYDNHSYVATVNNQVPKPLTFLSDEIFHNLFLKTSLNYVIIARSFLPFPLHSSPRHVLKTCDM